MSRLRGGFWRCALLGAAWVLLAPWAAAQTPVPIESLDLVDARPLVLQGHWFPLPGQDPAQAGGRPALVLLHGCGGAYGAQGRLSERMRFYTQWLQQLGVASLVLDSFRARGEREVCTQKMGTRKITQTERRRDALGALRWLAQQPGVDPARIGLLGWSHGGSTTLAASNRNHPEVVASTIQPALAIAFYPGCSAELQKGYQPMAPLLLLHGTADDWTPLAPCESLARAAQSPGVELHAYPGAYHGFDSEVPVRVRRDVPNGVHPGMGVHLGGDPQARADALRQLRRFLHQHWGTEQGAD